MKKTILTLCSFPLLFGAPAPLMAQTISVPPSIVHASASPDWWPGDPNPQPGTEAWCQLYGNTSPGNAETARRCALAAPGPGSLNAIGSRVLSGNWTLTSFAAHFGVNLAVACFNCIV